ncbi:hypothetical protein FACS1894199_14330 [Bacteroidia bacterium]|nr:hypothetical protein FACS1894199_14330 [Bacteroidia bacterium]
MIMDSKKYLIEKLNEIHRRFRNLSIKYQYCFNSNMHIVEVLPLCEYKDNAEYIEMESNLTFEFDNKFFPESVLFVSADSLTKVSAPQFVLNSENITKQQFEYGGFDSGSAIYAVSSR